MKLEEFKVISELLLTPKLLFYNKPNLFGVEEVLLKANTECSTVY